ncbi:MAG: DUF4411 family protein [Flavobacteriales bacterium]
MSLFQEQEPVYAFDSDALITLERYYGDMAVFDALWSDLVWLAKVDRLKVIDFVFQELVDDYKGTSLIKSWLTKHRKLCYWETGEQAMLLSQRVIRENLNSGFLKHQKVVGERDEADPFLIGNAAVEKFVIVTKEKSTVSNKLPQVAFKYGATSIGIADFLKERGFKLQRGS